MAAQIDKVNGSGSLESLIRKSASLETKIDAISDAYDNVL
jgi:hypothetical protein